MYLPKPGDKMQQFTGRMPFVYPFGKKGENLNRNTGRELISARPHGYSIFIDQ
jgi:hypothetical protein